MCACMPEYQPFGYSCNAMCMLIHLCIVANALCVFAYAFAGLYVGGRMAAVAGGGERGPHIGFKPAIDTHSILAKGCINGFCLCCQLLSNKVKCSESEGEKKSPKDQFSLTRWKMEHSMCFIYAVFAVYFIFMCV